MSDTTEPTAAERLRTLRATLDGSGQDTGRIAAYLRHRGLSGHVPDALCLCSGLDYYAGNGRPAECYPAIVAPVLDVSADLVNVHRTYLDRDTDGKAPVEAAKKLMTGLWEGATNGAAIRLAPAGPVLALAEGIETALAVMEATGTPAWSCVAAGFLEKVEIPPEVRRVEIWADLDPPKRPGDTSGRGEQAAEIAAARFVAEGREVCVLVPPDLGSGKADWLDVFNECGADVVRGAWLLAEPWQPTEASPKKAACRFWTPAELAERDDPEPVPVVEGYLYRESISELVSTPKLGKTTLAFAIVAAVVTGRPFAGQPTMRGPVVYLTEERPSTVGAVLRRVGLEDSRDLYLLFRHEAPKDWPETMTQAREKARTVGAVLLVVDTLGDWANLVGDAENNAGDALAAVRPLQAAAADGLAVLANRHERKGGGALGESGRGSSAFAGAVDVLIQLRRVDGQGHENRRELSAVGRFDHIPPAAVLELRDGQYHYLGTASGVEREEVRGMLLDLLPADREQAVPEKDLLDELTGSGWDGSRTTARTVLMALVGEGEAHRDKGAGQASPRSFGYWRGDRLGDN